jgi:hypothetical protein
MDYNENVKEGVFFKLSNNLTYIVIERYHTADLNGRFFKTYCKLKEHYAHLSN